MGGAIGVGSAVLRASAADDFRLTTLTAMSKVRG